MTTWIALIRKTNLKGTEDFTDIACLDAPTKEEAIRILQKHQWPESWWDTNSVLRVLKIFDRDELPNWVRVSSANRKVEPIRKIIRRRRFS